MAVGIRGIKTVSGIWYLRSWWGVNLLTCLNQPYNQNNFAYKDYDDTTTVGHQDKIIGIPKSDATVIYPYEWRIDALMDDKLTSDLQLSDAEKVTVENYERRERTEPLPTGHPGGQYVDFPLQKYLGYAAEDENGEKLEISYGNNYRIRVMLTGDGESHTVSVRYRQPVIFRLSQAVSCLLCCSVSLLR